MDDVITIQEISSARECYRSAPRGLANDRQRVERAQASSLDRAEPNPGWMRRDHMEAFVGYA